MAYANGEQQDVNGGTLPQVGGAVAGALGGAAAGVAFAGANAAGSDPAEEKVLKSVKRGLRKVLSGKEENAHEHFDALAKELKEYKASGVFDKIKRDIDGVITRLLGDKNNPGMLKYKEALEKHRKALDAGKPAEEIVELCKEYEELGEKVGKDISTRLAESLEKAAKSDDPAKTLKESDEFKSLAKELHAAMKDDKGIAEMIKGTLAERFPGGKTGLMAAGGTLGAVLGFGIIHGILNHVRDHAKATQVSVGGQLTQVSAQAQQTAVGVQQMGEATIGGMQKLAEEIGKISEIVVDREKAAGSHAARHGHKQEGNYAERHARPEGKGGLESLLAGGPSESFAQAEAARGDEGAYLGA